MVAFVNAEGGNIFIGVDNRGKITGVEGTQVHRLNQLISNTASQFVKSPLSVAVESASHFQLVGHI